MTNRIAPPLLALAALSFAMTAGVDARADADAKPSDYGVTEADRRDNDPIKMGAFVYGQRCAVCHARKSGEPAPYGPHLAGVVGRRAGVTGWPEHSDALKRSEIEWTEAALDRLLADPQKATPGINMDVIVRFKRSRTALIAYLKTL